LKQHYEGRRNVDAVKRFSLFGFKYMSVARCKTTFRAHGLPSFVEIFYFTLSSMVGEIRDRVYLALGISWEFADSKSLRSSIRPDYAMPVVEIFINITRHVIERRRDIQILCHRVDKALISTNGLPSWCPDYSLDLRSAAIRQFMDNCPFKASGVAQHQDPAPRICQRSLLVNARYVDRIVENDAARSTALIFSLVDENICSVFRLIEHVYAQPKTL
jgi:hypothetical protein